MSNHIQRTYSNSSPSNIYLVIMHTYVPHTATLTPKAASRMISSLKTSPWHARQTAVLNDINCVEKSEMNGNTYILACDSNIYTAKVPDNKDVEIVQKDEKNHDLLNVHAYGSLRICHFYDKPLQIFDGEVLVYTSENKSNTTLRICHFATSCKSARRGNKYFYVTSMCRLMLIDLPSFSETQLSDHIDDFCVTHSDSIMAIDSDGKMQWLASTTKTATDARSYRCMTAAGSMCVAAFAYVENLNYDVCVYSTGSCTPVSKVSIKVNSDRNTIKYLRAAIFGKLALIVAARVVGMLDFMYIDKGQISVVREAVYMHDDNGTNVTNGMLLRYDRNAGKKLDLLVYGYKFVVSVIIAI